MNSSIDQGQATMQATEKDRNSMRTGNINGSAASTSMQAKFAPLFALSASSTAPFPERFPRLTFLVIALLLLVSALTAEFEYLRCAGYYWP